MWTELTNRSSVIRYAFLVSIYCSITFVASALVAPTAKVYAESAHALPLNCDILTGVRVIHP